MHTVAQRASGERVPSRQLSHAMHAPAPAPCRDDLPAYSGPWPQRVYLAMGSAEYSGTRGGEASAASGGARFDTLLVGYCRQLAALLAAQGVGPDRLLWEVDEGAAHTESAWAARLPRALRWLGAQWRDGS